MTNNKKYASGSGKKYLDQSPNDYDHIQMNNFTQIQDQLNNTDNGIQLRYHTSKNAGRPPRGGLRSLNNTQQLNIQIPEQS